jgi:hypothetical protein
MRTKEAEVRNIFAKLNKGLKKCFCNIFAAPETLKHSNSHFVHEQNLIANGLDMLVVFKIREEVVSVNQNDFLVRKRFLEAAEHSLDL